MAYTVIGRIRPRPMGAWNAETEYETLDVAMQPDGAGAFMAIQNVPAGTELSNSGCWLPIVDVNAAVDAAREATDAAQKAAVEVKDDVARVNENLISFENEIAEKMVSRNRYNGEYDPGFYVNQITGRLDDNGMYSASKFIKVKNDTGSIVISAYSNFEGTCRYALYSGYDETTYIRGAVVNSAVHDDANNVYYAVIDVAGAEYIRFSMLGGNFADVTESKLMLAFGNESLPYAPYVEEEWKLREAIGLDSLKSSVYGLIPSEVSADTLENGTSLKITGSNSVKKNKVYHFRANVDSSFDAVYMGHGEGDYSLYFRLDGTNLAVMTNGIEGTALAHGLTIDTYFDLMLIVGNKSTGTLILNTLGGIYTKTIQAVNGYKGEIFMRPSGCTITNAHVGFSCSDFRQPIWMFGDSYFTHTSNIRWPYWLVEWGFDRCMLNAFPGENSTEAIAQAMNYIPNRGIPKYAVWCLGMNDPDVNGVVNSDWKSAVDRFVALCGMNSITPILATIPNVPNYTNYYKNEIVRNSGYRYIDFAKAVGAEEAGSSWYDGALSEDNVHPSEMGARLLCLQALKDMPELTL